MYKENMDKKLKKLFEFQKFTKNESLEKVIENERFEAAVEISDDQLFAAAGGVREKNKDESEIDRKTK